MTDRLQRSRKRRPGWIVRDAVTRSRNEYGFYHWYQWRVCIRAIGLRFVWLPENATSKGNIAGNTIYIRRGMTPEETAQVGWHEVGHALLHAGSAQFWGSKPGGAGYLRKLERQADDFAEHFPLWHLPLPKSEQRKLIAEGVNVAASVTCVEGAYLEAAD